MRKPYLPASGEFYQKQRMRALVRDNFECQAHQLGLCPEPCGEDRLRFLVIHHLQERQHGGNHDLDNLLTICRKHHADIHPHLRYELDNDGKTLGEDREWPWKEL